MVIHNATFMVLREKEEDVIRWLKSAVALLPEGEGYNPRVSAMREAGGVSAHHAEAASIAFQMEFGDIDKAREWGNTVFTRLADEFTARYGAESMVFTSLFEVV